RRHNLPWQMPTKTFPTVTAVAWLKGAGAARNHPPGDEPPARRSGAGREAPEGTGAGHRPALGRHPESEAPVLDAGRGDGRRPRRGAEDEFAFVRSLAAWHLGRLGPALPDIAQALVSVRQLEGDKDPSVRAEAALALGRLEGKGVPPPELKSLSRES
ncbi:MAG TPA: HEAT repeat domain-containing protein, partial [Gemmataceae bacterium]|nr:HEAT repeat domain-containing protein [Gemmataceae bacterium]